MHKFMYREVILPKESALCAINSNWSKVQLFNFGSHPLVKPVNVIMKVRNLKFGNDALKIQLSSISLATNVVSVSKP